MKFDTHLDLNEMVAVTWIQVMVAVTWIQVMVAVTWIQVAFSNTRILGLSVPVYATSRRGAHTSNKVTTLASHSSFCYKNIILLMYKETFTKMYMYALFSVRFDLQYGPYKHFGYWSILSDP